MINIKKIPLPVIIAIIGVCLLVFYLSQKQLQIKPQEPVRAPAPKTYPQSLGGVGIIESKEKNIAISPFYSGVVSKVFVVEGSVVSVGAPLYQLDTTALQSQLTTAQAQAEASKALLLQQQHQPRDVDIPPLKAAVETAKANASAIEMNLDRLKAVSNPNAVSADELSTKTQQLAASKAQLAQAEANLKKALAGAWSYEIKQTQQQLKASVAKVHEIQVQLNHAIVRSPISGKVLQVNVRPGAYAVSGASPGSVILGRDDLLQVRVDIDEVNASRVKPGMAATAYLKGDSDEKFPLNFIRIEPFMVPKKSLTGDTNERTDVRVLQVIYDFKPPAFPVYVGQQVVVYLNKNTQVKSK